MDGKNLDERKLRNIIVHGVQKSDANCKGKICLYKEELAAKLSFTAGAQADM